ncbi:MAG: hypothetical protein G01um101425_387 [Candidatus Peregrinibacteria bacterium Gr01-1014_25]|nr:MAG: hypothetical protein G01um101425_387 [Candidatus Peregrinibacteria bacterium Gr01-1014_25]
MQTCHRIYAHPVNGLQTHTFLPDNFWNRIAGETETR